MLLVPLGFFLFRIASKIFDSGEDRENVWLSMSFLMACKACFTSRCNWHLPQIKIVVVQLFGGVDILTYEYFYQNIPIIVVFLQLKCNSLQCHVQYKF